MGALPNKERGICLALSLDLACSGCNRSTLVLTLSLTMLISIEGMDDFRIEQLHPQGLCRRTLPSMARSLSRRYADGHRGIRNYGYEHTFEKR